MQPQHKREDDEEGLRLRHPHTCTDREKGELPPCEFSRAPPIPRSELPLALGRSENFEEKKRNYREFRTFRKELSRIRARLFCRSTTLKAPLRRTKADNLQFEVRKQPIVLPIQMRRKRSGDARTPQYTVISEKMSGGGNATAVSKRGENEAWLVHSSYRVRRSAIGAPCLPGREIRRRINGYCV